MLAAAPLSSALSTVLTVDLDLSASRTVFFIVQTPAEAYRFCLHLVVTPDGRVFGAVRRFFPEAALVFDKILLALEAGELCGLVTQLRAPLLCYERLAELVDARADPERTRAAVCELGLPLLRQMAGVGARDGTGVPVSVNMQMWFSERGGAPASARTTVAECSNQAQAAAPGAVAGCSKQAQAAAPGTVAGCSKQAQAAAPATVAGWSKEAEAAAPSTVAGCSKEAEDEFMRDD